MISEEHGKSAKHRPKRKLLETFKYWRRRLSKKKGEDMAGEIKRHMAIGVTPLFIKRKWEVYYLGPWPLQNIQDVINTIPSEAFYKTVATHVNAVLEEGKMPPAEISSAILNFADDIRSGRQPVIRSGDYIAIQNYVKKAK